MCDILTPEEQKAIAAYDKPATVIEPGASGIPNEGYVWRGGKLVAVDPEVGRDRLRGFKFGRKADPLVSARRERIRALIVSGVTDSTVIAATLGVTSQSVSRDRSILGLLGPVKKDQIAALLKKGVDDRTIAQRLGANLDYVMEVRRKVTA